LLFCKSFIDELAREFARELIKAIKSRPKRRKSVVSSGSKMAAGQPSDDHGLEAPWRASLTNKSRVGSPNDANHHADDGKSDGAISQHRPGERASDRGWQPPV